MMNIVKTLALYFKEIRTNFESHDLNEDLRKIVPTSLLPIRLPQTVQMLWEGNSNDVGTVLLKSSKLF